MSKYHDAVWKAWKSDEFMAPPEKHHSELKGKDKEEFEQHVSDVKAHAEKHKIKHPMDAVAHYTDHLAAKHFTKEELEAMDEEIKSNDANVKRAAADAERRHKIAQRALEQHKLKSAKEKHDDKVTKLNKDIRMTEETPDPFKYLPPEEKAAMLKAHEKNKTDRKANVAGNKKRTADHMYGIRKTDSIAQDLIKRKREKDAKMESKEESDEKKWRESPDFHARPHLDKRKSLADKIKKLRKRK